MQQQQQQQQQQQRPPTTRQGIRLQTGSPKRVICLGTQPQPDTQTHQPLLPLLKGAVSQRIQAESQLSQTYSQDEFTSHTNSKDKGQKVDHNSKYLNLLASFQKINMSMKIASITYNYRRCLSLAYQFNMLKQTMQKDNANTYSSEVESCTSSFLSQPTLPPKPALQTEKTGKTRAIKTVK